jgi:hypothetical protein
MCNPLCLSAGLKCGGKGVVSVGAGMISDELKQQANTLLNFMQQMKAYVGSKK